MITLYWISFLGGIFFTLILFLVGDFLSAIFDSLDFGSALFRPVTLLGTMTAFGTSGLVLTKATSFSPSIVFWFSIGISIVSFFLLYVIWVRPMEYADNSTAFSIQELKGKTGEVITTLPSKGYGEVLILVGSGHTNQIAASLDQQEIPQGTKVIVVEVKNHTLYVTPWEKAGDNTFQVVKKADK